MNKIPLKLRKQLSEDPSYQFCARVGMDCSGRITWEHTYTYAGEQIQRRWAIIPLCAHHHLGAGLIKAINQLLAINRATPEDLKEFPKIDWDKERRRLAYHIEETRKRHTQGTVGTLAGIPVEVTRNMSDKEAFLHFAHRNNKRLSRAMDQYNQGA